MAAIDWVKDPEAVLDWHWDWSEWLDSNESITASTMTVTPGLTLDSDTFSLTSTTAWLSGGTAGQVYLVTNQITTDAGRVDERSITIRVTNR